jgi:hypothetical protein
MSRACPIEGLPLYDGFILLNVLGLALFKDFSTTHRSMASAATLTTLSLCLMQKLLPPGAKPDWHVALPTSFPSQDLSSA